MSLDNINLIDSQDTVKEDSRVSRNQIKMKRLTFEAVSGKWRNFRLSLYRKKLERKKQEFVDTDVSLEPDYSRLSRVSERVLKSKSKTIAKLEEKIMFLSGDNVPYNYVKDRAIKLRSNMMRNLIFNVRDGFYHVEEGKEEEVFHNDLIPPVVDNNAQPVENVPVVEEAPQKAPEPATTVIDNVESVQPVDESVIDDVIRSYADNIQTVSPDKSEEVSNVVNPIPESSPATQEMVPTSTMESVEENDDLLKQVESYIEEENKKSEDINQIPPVVEEEKVEEDTTEVSDHKEWVPLTEEQIAQMREDLNRNFADEYRQSIGLDRNEDTNVEEPVRDEVVVAPERKEEDKDMNYNPIETDDEDIESYSFNEEPAKEENADQELNLDYSNASKNDLENAVNNASTIADLEVLRRRVEESHKRAEAAERRQKETQQRLKEMEEARRQREEEERRTEENLQKMVAELNQRIMATETYSDAVEDDCEFNETKTREVEEEEQETRRRIEEKRRQAEELDALLGTFTPGDDDNKAKGR